MEFPIKLFGKTNSSINFYFNFSLQALHYFHWTLQFDIILLIFFVIIINVLTELEVVASVCQMVGDAVKDVSKNDVLTIEELDRVAPIQVFKKTETSCDEISSQLLKMILKYHSRIIL